MLPITTSIANGVHFTHTGLSKKRHKVYGTIILQLYVIVTRFSAKCSERNSLRDKSQYLNTTVKYSLLLLPAIKLCKNSITLDTAVHKNVPLFTCESSYTFSAS